MQLTGEQIFFLCAAFLLVGVVYGYWRGVMHLTGNLLLRAGEKTAYKLGGEFVYVVKAAEYACLSTQALKWELSKSAETTTHSGYQETSKTLHDKILGLSWHDVRRDMLSRSRELLRWVRESNEPMSEMVVAWFAWECTQAAWHAVGLETGLYPIHTQRWDGGVNSPFVTVMEQRRLEEQAKNIKLMGEFKDDSITPKKLAASLREDLMEAGVDLSMVYVTPEAGSNADFGERTGPGVTPTGQDSVKADPAQELDDRIRAFNSRTEEDEAIRRAVDREDHARFPERDPYGSSMLNEDVAAIMTRPSDCGMDLGKVKRATEPDSFAGAPLDLPDTLRGNWYVISTGGDFYGPFEDRTQANDKAKGSSLVAWSLGQSSPDEFLTLCSQGKGHNGDTLPPLENPRWYMRWTNNHGTRLAGPYRTEEQARDCGKRMRLPLWDVTQESDGPGIYEMPGIYFFNKEGKQQSEIGPVGHPSQAIIQAVHKDYAEADGNWYVVLKSSDIANKVDRFEYVGPFGTLEAARAWRRANHYGARDNVIRQIQDIKSAVEHDAVVTPPSFP